METIQRVSPAESLLVDSGSVQIVNSSQACHWFDLPNFFREVDRVLCPNGIVALSGYGIPYVIHPDKSEELRHQLSDVSHSFKHFFKRSGKCTFK
jgi:SAM-dependent methyltransferase